MKKGQWFLISAVVATGVFLSMSSLFKTYFAVDPSLVASQNEEYYFHDVREQFNVVAQSPCTELNKNLREFRAFAERSMADLGYLLYLSYTINGCDVRNVRMLLASSRTVICENIPPSMLGGIYPTDIACA